MLNRLKVGFNIVFFVLGIAAGIKVHAKDVSQLNRPEVRWLTPMYAPFVFQKKGETVGVYYSILSSLFDQMGYSLKIKNVPLRRVYNALHDGSGDITIIPSRVWKSENRNFDKAFTCDLPFFNLEVGLYFKKGTFDRNVEISSLKTHRIYTNQLSTDAIIDSFVQGQPFVKVSDTTTMLDHLHQERAKLVLNYKLLLTFIAEQKKTAYTIDKVARYNFNQEHMLCFSKQFIEQQPPNFIEKAKSTLLSIKGDKELEAKINKQVFQSHPVQLQKLIP